MKSITTHTEVTLSDGSRANVVMATIPDITEDERGVLLSLVTAGLPQDAPLIYKGRRNRLAHVTRGAASVVVKSFRVPHRLNSVVYGWRLRRSKAERSFVNALTLIDNGFHTPRPIGYIELRRHGLLRQSYYVCDYVADTSQVHDLWQKPWAVTVMTAMARDLARLHSLGIHMRDYSPGNVIYTLGDRPGDVRLNYVDLNRMTFGVTSRHTLDRAFSAIFWDDEALRTFARLYAAASGQSPDDVERRAFAAHRAFIRRRDLKSNLKKLVISNQ